MKETVRKQSIHSLLFSSVIHHINEHVNLLEKILYQKYIQCNYMIPRK